MHDAKLQKHITKSSKVILLICIHKISKIKLLQVDKLRSAEATEKGKQAV